MTSLQHVALLLLSLSGLSAVSGSRAQELAFAKDSTAAPDVCVLAESAKALGYGVKASFPVKSCVQECKWHRFLTQNLPNDIVGEPKLSDDEKYCKCYYAEHFWKGNEAFKQFWFQFHMYKIKKCERKECLSTFWQWGNMFLKKKHFKEDRMPNDKLIEYQDNYELTCKEGGEPEGIKLPSPDDKIRELRLALEQCGDPEGDECKRIQQLLDELLKDKEVEVFSYDVDGDWGPERQVDAEFSGEQHTFQLKPCKSQRAREVKDLKEILELCGPWEEGVTMQTGKLRVSYNADGDWGPELTCPDEEVCKPLLAATSERGKLLSFRLKPCTTEGGQLLEDLAEILGDHGCGIPTVPQTLLPVVVSVSQKLDAHAPADELPFPCP